MTKIPIGSMAVAGDIDFDGTVTGVSQQGRNYTTGGINIGAGASRTVTIALNKEYKTGRAHLESKWATPAGNLGRQLFFNDEADKAVSMQALMYGGNHYAKDLGAAFLTTAVFSTIWTGIALSDIYIDNVNKLLTMIWYNKDAGTRTLMYYLTWQVW